MTAFGWLIRAVHAAVVTALAIPSLSYLFGVVAAGDGATRITNLIVFLVLALPLGLLLLRLRRRPQFYPLSFISAHPVRAVALSALALASVAMLLAALIGRTPGPAYLAGENMLGLVLYGVGLAWLSVLAYEISFRTARSQKTPNQS